MHILPTQAASGSASIALAGAVTGDAMTDAVDAAELFDIDVDQFAQPVALVSNDRWPRRKRRKTAETMTTQNHTDGRDGALQPPGDCGAGEALLAERYDLGFRRWAELARTTTWPRRTVS